jgi:hypothetical protein
VQTVPARLSARLGRVDERGLSDRVRCRSTHRRNRSRWPASRRGDRVGSPVALFPARSCATAGAPQAVNRLPKTHFRRPESRGVQAKKSDLYDPRDDKPPLLQKGLKFSARRPKRRSPSFIKRRRIGHKMGSDRA